MSNCVIQTVIKTVEKLVTFITKTLVSMLGIGFIPGSGTIASFIVVISSIMVFMQRFIENKEVTFFYYLGYAVPLILICYILLWIHSLFVAHSDQKYIVVDEIAGQLIAMSTGVNNLFDIMLSFIIFRILDIYKPWPISTIDRNKTSIHATMMDDVVAGAVTAIIILVLRPLLIMIALRNKFLLPGLLSI